VTGIFFALVFMGASREAGHRPVFSGAQMDTTKRITELESTVARLERKIAVCEVALQAMAERRKRLGLEVLDTPEMEVAVRDGIQSAAKGWQDSRWSSDVRIAARKAVIFERERAALIARAEEEKETADAKLAAEVIEVIAFYEEHHRMPNGWDLVEDVTQ
jgi:hypothetical protein